MTAMQEEADEIFGLQEDDAPICITVNSRIVLPIEGMDTDVQKQLLNAFRHPNPQWHKMQSMGYRYTKEPKSYELGRLGANAITLPRGGMDKVRTILDQARLEYEIDDQRSQGDQNLVGSYLDTWNLSVPSDIFPEHRQVLWDHQEEMIQAIVDYQQGIFRSPTGCITGEAMIGINRSRRARQVRLDYLVRMQNGGESAPGKTWNPEIPTMVRAMMPDGRIRLHKLKNAYESGVKDVHLLQLENGNEIEATTDHRFLTSDGWKCLGQLSQEDEILCEPCRRPVRGRGKCEGRKPRPSYRQRRVPYHPHASRKGVAKGYGSLAQLHRLVVEADMNGMDTDTFIARCKGKLSVRGLRFLNPDLVVHHKDYDVLNNELSNLEVMTEAEHRQVHMDNSVRNIAAKAAPSKVESITFLGRKTTYDLEMEGEPHNFIANGMVVHNSGKTTALLAAIARIQLPSLVIMWDTGLLKQWQERIEAELGIPVEEQGLIQGKNLRLKPITLAMQQTLHRWTDEKWSALNGVFGLVACDEVQRYAANTFTGIIDRVDCQYRIGVSASEKRKDKKQFLIYDMFGGIRHETTKKELVKKRIIHDVEVMVVPTGFAAPWYRQLQEEKANTGQAYNRLLDEMQSDQDRNDLVLALIKTAVEREGLDTLVFAHRTEHCQRIDSMVTGAGIKSGLMLGGKDWEATFDETINALRAGEKQVGVGTFKKLGVGHDIPNVAAGVAATPVHSNREFLDQVKGRICRKSDGKLNARIYVLWDRLVFGNFPLHNLRNWNPTVRVWDEVNKKWLEASQYLKEQNDGEWATKDTIESSIFVSANT